MARTAAKADCFSRYFGIASNDAPIHESSFVFASRYRPLSQSRQLIRSFTVSKQLVLLNFIQALCAIILGNIVYFLLLPSLPSAAHHHPLKPDLGLFIDFWFCLVAYGLIRTVRKWR
jgi:hypothetical protein